MQKDIKKGLMVALIVIALVRIPVAIQASNDTYVPIKQVVVVHLREDEEFRDEYDFLASIPVSIFHKGGSIYVSPLIADNLNPTLDYLLEDWKAYCDSWGRVERLLAVGNVSYEVASYLMEKLGYPAYIPIMGRNVYEDAALISLMEWKRSNIAILAPFPEGVNFTKEYLESASNAAVIASLLNAPLLFTAPDKLSEATYLALTALRTKMVIIVEVGDLISDKVEEEIKALGMVIKDLEDIEDVVSYIYSRVGAPYLSLTYPTDGTKNFFLAASQIAAYHGGVILGIPEEIREFAEKVWIQTELEFYELYGPPRKPMEELAEMTYGWLSNVGADWEDKTETIFVFADHRYEPRIWSLSFYKKTGILPKVPGVAICFDRALTGKAIVGRFAGENYVDNILFVDRSILYKALIFTNPGRNSATASMIAYTIPTGFFSRVRDNYGNWHICDDFKIPETMEKAGFEVKYHTSFDSIVKALNKGSTIWYYSNHGGRDGRYGGLGLMGYREEDMKWGAESYSLHFRTVYGGNVGDRESYNITFYMPGNVSLFYTWAIWWYADNDLNITLYDPTGAEYPIYKRVQFPLLKEKYLPIEIDIYLAFPKEFMEGWWTIKVDAVVSVIPEDPALFGLKPEQYSLWWQDKEHFWGSYAFVNLYGVSTEERISHEFEVPEGSVSIWGQLMWPNVINNLDLYLFDPEGVQFPVHHCGGASEREQPKSPLPLEVVRAYDYEEIMSGIWNLEVFGKNVSAPTLPWGEPYEFFYATGSLSKPDINYDGVVNPFEVAYHWSSGKMWDDALGNLRSTIPFFMACSTGGSELPVIMMRHGAVASIATYTPLFIGGGDLEYMQIMARICEGKPIGQSLLEVLKNLSYLYSLEWPPESNEGGSSLDFELPEISVDLEDPKVSLKLNVQSNSTMIFGPVGPDGTETTVIFGDPTLIVYRPGAWKEPVAVSPFILH